MLAKTSLIDELKYIRVLFEGEFYDFFRSRGAGSIRENTVGVVCL